MQYPEAFFRSVLFWGKVKQELISNSTIIVAGVGGLGCFVSQLLVRAGIGKLILIDNDMVSESDLNRQILYTTKDIGESKVKIAAQKLNAINKFSKVIPLKITIEDKKSFLKNPAFAEYTGIADCLDNYESRLIIQNLLKDEIFMVHGGVENDYGQLTTIIKNSTVLLQDIYADYKMELYPIPVIPQSVSVIATFMTHEIINNILGMPQLLNQLLIMELSDFSIFKIALKK